MRLHFIAGLVIACATASGFVSPAWSQTSLPLSEARPIPRDGAYSAGDNIAFALDHFGDWVRLRFADTDEVFWLTSEAAPLGARVLKYDTGDPALRVTGWGGVTLYTPSDKTGIPAELSDGSTKVEPPATPMGDARRFATGLVKEIDSRSDFAIGFAANWDELARSDLLKSLVCDAMRNASLALEQAAAGPARNTISDRLHVVRIITGDRVSAVVRQGVLTITVAPKLGPASRPSSLMIARSISAAFPAR